MHTEEIHFCHIHKLLVHHNLCWDSGNKLNQFIGGFYSDTYCYCYIVVYLGNAFFVFEFVQHLGNSIFFKTLQENLQNKYPKRKVIQNNTYLCASLEYSLAALATKLRNLLHIRNETCYHRLLPVILFLYLFMVLVIILVVKSLNLNVKFLDGLKNRPHHFSDIFWKCQFHSL